MQKSNLYSPRQVFWGTFFGGPIALTFFLHQNFYALERPTEAYKTAIIGLGISLAILLVLMLTPSGTASTVVFVISAFVGKHFVTKDQFSAFEANIPDTHTAHSNWRVFWGAVACFLAWVVVAVVAVVLLESAGLRTDG